MPFVEKSIEILQNFGFLAGILIIILESMIPILPLGLFVAFNFSAYGYIVGFLISYVSTIAGCIIAYYLANFLFGVYIKKKSDEYEKLNKLVKKMQTIKLSNLVLIIALPFTPAFLVNIAAGIIKMDLKKFIVSLFIGKISIVYFWGMVGKSFIDSIGDIKTMSIILLLLVFSYILSKIVSKKMNLE